VSAAEGALFPHELPVTVPAGRRSCSLRRPAVAAAPGRLAMRGCVAMSAVDATGTTGVHPSSRRAMDGRTPVQDRRSSQTAAWPLTPAWPPVPDTSCPDDGRSEAADGQSADRSRW
jgi:hypothetical protein